MKPKPKKKEAAQNSIYPTLPSPHPITPIFQAAEEFDFESDVEDDYDPTADHDYYPNEFIDDEPSPSDFNFEADDDQDFCFVFQSDFEDDIQPYIDVDPAPPHYQQAQKFEFNAFNELVDDCINDDCINDDSD